MTDPACVLCDAVRAERELHRMTVWDDAVWRLSTTLFGAIPGFSYLEPKRHVPHITDLTGEEARVLAPYREGDALNSAVLRGELIAEKQPNGTTIVRSVDFPPRPAGALRAAA